MGWGWLIGIVAVLVAFAAAVHGVESWEESIKAEAFKAGYNQARAEDNAAAILAQQAVDKKAADQRAQQAINEAKNAKRRRLDRADADRTATELAELQQCLAAGTCGGVNKLSGSLAVTGSGPPAATTGNLLSECAGALSKVAADADDARTRGALCEQNYDALVGKLTRSLGGPDPPVPAAKPDG